MTREQAFLMLQNAWVADSFDAYTAANLKLPALASEAVVTAPAPRLTRSTPAAAPAAAAVVPATVLADAEALSQQYMTEGDLAALQRGHLLTWEQLYDFVHLRREREDTVIEYMSRICELLHQIAKKVRVIIL